MKIEEAEEILRNKGGGSAEDHDTFKQLAQWYAELNNMEKALDYLRTALIRLGRPDVEVLNLQGIYYSRLGDFKRAEKAYREASAITTWSIPLFNLAIGYQRRGKNQKALEILEEIINREDYRGSKLTLKAICLSGLEKETESRNTLEEAIRNFDPPKLLDRWELGWYSTAAELLGKKKYIKKAKEAQEKNKTFDIESLEDDTLRPYVKEKSD